MICVKISFIGCWSFILNVDWSSKIEDVGALIQILSVNFCSLSLRLEIYFLDGVKLLSFIMLVLLGKSLITLERWSLSNWYSWICLRAWVQL